MPGEIAFERVVVVSHLLEDGDILSPLDFLDTPLPTWRMHEARPSEARGMSLQNESICVCIDVHTQMFDVDVFLSKCPWIHEIENGTELMVAWATHGRRQMESGIVDIDGKIGEIEDAIETVVDDIDRRLEERLKPLQDVLTSKVATTKGKTGELLYENWIGSEISKSWDTVCTKSVPHHGDFVHTHYDSKQRVVVDVKNYAKNVPSCEVEKLWSDMETQSIHLGLLVSMNSRFACRRSSMDIEFRTIHGKHSTMILIPNALHAKELVYVGLEILRLHNPKSQFDVDEIVRPLQEILAVVGECETNLCKMEKDLTSSIGVFRQSMQMHYNDIQHRIRGMLK